MDEEEPEVVQAPTPMLVPPPHRGHLNLAASIRAMVAIARSVETGERVGLASVSGAV